MTESSRAVFLSYASQDGPAAQKICEALRAAGIEVWFDQSELRGGDAWDHRIREQIHNCRLFIPVISANSEHRDEGYFRREWGLAVDRTRDIAHKRAFLVPVVIDATPERGASVPEKFHDLQWTRLPNGDTPPEFVERIRHLLSPEPSSSAGSATAHSGAVAAITPPVRPSRSLKPGLLVAVAVVVLGAVAYFAVEKPWISKSAMSSPTVAAAQSPIATAGASLAVLPFVNMSGDKEQEYFSDGLSEELLNEIAQVKGLRVIARTSSFAFKGKNEDLRVIGEKLGVNHLLEGSVRTVGRQLRIAAQLVNAADGSHIWSESYDRNLDDIFKVQEDIASHVVEALSVSLGIGDVAAEGGTRNVEAYTKYLRARELSGAGGRAEDTAAIGLFREAVALDPRFAKAWFDLYRAYALSLEDFPENQAQAIEGMAEASRQVVTLAPHAWWTQAMQSQQLMYAHRWSDAEAAAQAALHLAPPSSADAAGQYGYFLFSVGRVKEALEQFKRAQQIDPLSLGLSGFVQGALQADGQFDAAQEEYVRSKDLAGDPEIWDFWALRRMWRRGEAAPAAVKAQYQVFLDHYRYPDRLPREVANKIDDAPAVIAAANAAIDQSSNQNYVSMEFVAQLIDHYRGRDLVLEALERAYITLHGRDYVVLWLPWETGVRVDPRFKRIVREAGLVDYWRQSGHWSDFCQPSGADDFECH